MLHALFAGRQKPTAVKSKKGKQAAAELAADLDTATTPALAAADGHDSAEPTDGAGQQNCVEPGNVAKKKQKSATKPPGLLAAVAGNSGSLDQVLPCGSSRLKAYRACCII